MEDSKEHATLGARFSLGVASVAVVGVIALGLALVAIVTASRDDAAVAGSPTSTSAPESDAGSPGESELGSAPEASTEGLAPEASTEGSADSAVEPGGPRIEYLPAEELVPGESAPFGDGVETQLLEMESIQGQGSGVGEIGGPAVAFTIEVANGTKSPIEAPLVVVDAYYSRADVPATPLLSDPRSDRIVQTIPSGESRSGTYVFVIDPAQRDWVSLTVSYLPEKPTVVFQGSAPR